MDTFVERYGPWAVVAGASNGIGRGFARQFAERGVNVVLVARDPVTLRREAEELEHAHGVDTVTCVADLTTDHGLRAVVGTTAELDVGALVYNAGAVHGAGVFHERPVADALFLVDLNCRGPVVLTHHFAGRFVARGHGGIVLMSSMAALAGSAYVAAYSASKAFDINLAEGLAIELRPHGVDAMAVVAGATRTPALLASGATVDESVYSLMEPDDVARGALDALGTTSLWVAGPANQQAFDAMRSMPRADVSSFMSQGAASLYDLPVL